MMRERQERKTKQKNKIRRARQMQRVHEAAIPAASSQLAQGDNIKSVHDVI